MRNYAMMQFNFMKHDVEACKMKGLDEEKEIECCSLICKNYWQNLQRQMVGYDFQNDEGEIDFFKNIKPLFTSEIEYYNLMMHALLFKPFYDRETMQKFWQRESLRLNEFCEANQEFCNYYKSGETGLDLIFYLRRNNEDFKHTHPALVELEKSTSSRNDRLLAEYLALDKYAQYVQQQLAQLNAVANGNG